MTIPEQAVAEADLTLGETSSHSAAWHSALAAALPLVGVNTTEPEVCERNDEMRRVALDTAERIIQLVRSGETDDDCLSEGADEIVDAMRLALPAQSGSGVMRQEDVERIERELIKPLRMEAELIEGVHPDGTARSRLMRRAADALALPHTGQPQEGNERLRIYEMRVTVSSIFQLARDAAPNAKTLKAIREAAERALTRDTSKAAAPASPRTEGEWQPIETWSLKEHGHHVIGWHPGGFGVAEYRFYEEGGWQVAAFNGQRIKRKPQKWQPMPRSPIFDRDDDAVVADHRQPETK
jgi:hypothetical protein